MEWLVFLIVWIILCAAIAKWAARKGKHAADYFFLSLFLSPLLGLILVAISEPDLKSLASQGKLKQCPDCAEYVQAAARKCRYCGHTFSVPEVGEIPPEIEARLLKPPDRRW